MDRASSGIEVCKTDRGNLRMVRFLSSPAHFSLVWRGYNEGDVKKLAAITGYQTPGVAAISGS